MQYKTFVIYGLAYPSMAYRESVLYLLELVVHQTRFTESEGGIPLTIYINLWLWAQAVNEYIYTQTLPILYVWSNERLGIKRPS